MCAHDKSPLPGLLSCASVLLMSLELFEEVAGRAGDVDSAGGAALAVLDALDDAGWFGALRTIGALVSIHDLLTVAGLGNLRHNACSPWFECFGSRAGCVRIDGLEDVQTRRHPELLVKIFPGRAAAGIGGEELRLWLSKEFTRQRPLLEVRGCLRGDRRGCRRGCGGLGGGWELNFVRTAGGSGFSGLAQSRRRRSGSPFLCAAGLAIAHGDLAGEAG